MIAEYAKSTLKVRRKCAAGASAVRRKCAERTPTQQCRGCRGRGGGPVYFCAGVLRGEKSRTSYEEGRRETRRVMNMRLVTRPIRPSLVIMGGNIGGSARVNSETEPPGATRQIKHVRRRQRNNRKRATV